MKTTLPPTTDHHRPVIGERLAVHLRSLRKVHGKGAGAVTALQDVDHGFPAGTFTAVMGPSGSGKSTLMHCAAGLERPTAGSVELGGRDLSKLSDRQLTLLRRPYRVGVCHCLDCRKHHGRFFTAPPCSLSRR